MLLVGTMIDISEHLPLYLGCLLLAGLLAMVLNHAVLGRPTGGLIFLQVSFAFNTAIVLFGWARGLVRFSGVAHCLLYELMAAGGIYWIYRKLLRHRIRLLERLGRLHAAAVAALLVSFNLAMFALFLVFVVRNEGGSRIEFMNAGWFSFLKPTVSLLTPLTFFFPVYLLDRGQRFLPLMILSAAILSSIASGSKGALVFGFIGAALLYRDIKGSRLAIPKSVKIILLLVLSLSVTLTLARLDVTLPDLAQRFIRFGESAVLVYYADDPASAADGVSTLAKIHRGAARLLGDPSAADIDTAFGFALNRADSGAQNFTGPNAQISSYMMCNYSGWGNLIGIASIFGYLAILSWFVERFLGRGDAGTALLLPFAVASLSDFLQDYYQGMSDVTLILMLAMALAGIDVVRSACRTVASAAECV
ncbi:MAG: hypothetical protein WCF68_18950 [Terriglobales bacterium]